MVSVSVSYDGVSQSVRVKEMIRGLLGFSGWVEFEGKIGVMNIEFGFERVDRGG